MSENKVFAGMLINLEKIRKNAKGKIKNKRVIKM